MQKLVEGIHRFRSAITGTQAAKFQRLAKGQNPIAMMITCADSRINPNLITQTEPGDLFILRNVGNIVPPHGTSNNGEAAAIEFAVAGLGVRDIIICGHTHCGAMKGLIVPKTVANLPATSDWLRHAQATKQIVTENYTHLKGDKLLTATAEENVLVQLQQLETIPVVASRCMRGELNLHAWMYKIETGEVFAYNLDTNQFLPLEIASDHGSREAKQDRRSKSGRTAVKRATRKAHA